MAVEGSNDQAKKDRARPAEGHILLGPDGEDWTTKIAEPTTILPVVYCPLDKHGEVILLQGGVGVGIDINGMAIKWNTLFGFVSPERLPGGVRWGLPAVPGMVGREEGPVAAFSTWEKEASNLAYMVERDIEAGLMAMKNNPLYNRMDWAPKPDALGDLHLEIDIENIDELRRDILLDLAHYAKQGKLRQDSGYYSWIGLSSRHSGRNYPLSTLMTLPDFVRNTRPLRLRSNVQPFSPDTEHAITPIDDGFAAAIYCGMIHAFEHQSFWNASSSIRAALFQSVFGNNLSLERILAAATRVNMFPRLCSSSTTDGNGPTYFWTKLAALGLTWEWFQRSFPKDLPLYKDNVGQVRFVVPAEGISPIMQDLVSTYPDASFTKIEGQSPASSVNGLFFYPAFNVPGAEHSFDYPQELYVHGREAMVGMPLQKPVGRTPSIIWSGTVLAQNRDGSMDLTKEQQLGYIYNLVRFETIEQVRKRYEFQGAGLIMHKLIIRDRLAQGGAETDRPYMPSSMLMMLCTGWGPRFTPRTILQSTAPQRQSTLSEATKMRVSTSLSLMLAKDAAGMAGA